MISRAGGGFIVKSESGKNLSKPGLSRAAAEKRLAQVEYFKHRKKKRPKGFGHGLPKNQ